MAVPAGKLVDDDAKFAQTRQDSASGVVNACGPKSPDSHRVVWGLITRPPVSPAGFPPVSRLPAGFFPFVRLPLASLRPTFSGCSLRPLPGSGSPSVSLRVPFPLSNLYISAAARRFPRRWSRAAGTNATSSTTPLGSRDPPARRMGSGWAGWVPQQSRLLRATASAGHRRARTAQIGRYLRARTGCRRCGM